MMKQKFKRVLAFLLAIVSVAASIFGYTTETYAASPSAKLMLWNASTKAHAKVSEFSSNYSGMILYSMIDGHIAYCMNFGLDAHSGYVMGSSDAPTKTDLSMEQRRQLAYCMYYGYGHDVEEAPTLDQRDQYIATQAVVWIIENGIFGTAGADSAATTLTNSAPNPESSYAYYVTLRDQIASAMNIVVPSFASRAESMAETYTLSWNDENQRFEVTLEDGNSVLDGYDLSLDGFSFEKGSSSITISTTEVKTEAVTGKLTANSGRVETPNGCVFWVTGNASDQEFVSDKPSADPVNAYFRVVTDDIGYGYLEKIDKATGTKLKGAVYGIYSDILCTKLVEQMVTGDNGGCKSGALRAGTYYVKEITSPNGYVLDSEVHTLVVKPGETVWFTAKDDEQKGSITIYKEGEVLTGWNGTDFTYEKRYLSGAEFSVTAGEDIFRADGVKEYSKGDIIAEGLTTNADGKAVLDHLHFGTYSITETKSVDGYVLNGTPQTVTITYEDQSVSVQYEEVTIQNERQKAEVTVVKLDGSTNQPLPNGEFSLYAGNDIRNHDGKVIMTKDTRIQTVQSGTDGTAVFYADLPVSNSYYVKETKAPLGYTKRDDEVYMFTFEPLEQEKNRAEFVHTFYDDSVKVTLHLYKADAETGKAVPQGNASLKGAVYGLYAREDIVYPDGISGVIYPKDTLIAELVTDEQAEAGIGDLYLGKYYLKEISAPEGYNLDTREYDIDCTGVEDGSAEAAHTITVKEDVKKQAFQLIKISENESETEGALLEGAGFSAYLKSDLAIKEDGSYDFASSVPVVIGENGATTIYTDQYGHAVSIPLPYGTYVVAETKTPHNMETIKPFEVTVSEHKPEEPQVWRVFLDREFEAKLRIIKADEGTKKPVLTAGAEFRILNLDTKEYVSMFTSYPSKVKHTTFATDEDGDLILPEPLTAGRYQIEEVTAPYGYQRNMNPVEVVIDSDTFYEVDPDTYEAVITITYEDKPVTGKLTVEKRGEILSGYKGSLFADSTEKQFVYEETGLAGAVFSVYAAEDIITPDNQKDEEGNAVIIYRKGEQIAELTTGADGKASLDGLPLGQYRVEETKAPDGYLLDKESHLVTIKYADDLTPVVSEVCSVYDEREKVSLSVVKLDSDTKQPLSGAVFGLYAGEDIQNAGGRVIVKEGELLEQAESGTDGTILFQKDYPFATYTVKEIKAPAGYASSDERIVFAAEYVNQNTPVAEYRAEIQNDSIVFEFTKEDITSGAELTGATLSVFDQDEKLVEQWISKAGEAHKIRNLLVGETYILREESAPYGYLRTTDVEFTVKDTKTIQSVVMKDDVPTGTIIINKDGELLQGIVEKKWYQTIFDWKKSSLAGVTFEVHAAEDVVSPDGRNTCYYAKDELVTTIVTDKDGIAKAEGLPLGRYYLVETATISGFVLNSTKIMADLSYIDQNTKVVYAKDSMENERQKVSVMVVKKDAVTGEKLEGAVFGLYAKNDIVSKDGTVVLPAGELVEKAVTDSEGRILFQSDLPLGEYYVKEMEAPEGYASNSEIYDVNALYRGSDVEVVEVNAVCEDQPLRVRFSKTDITGEHEVEGAKLTVLDTEGNVVESWVSTKEPHLIERIPAGDYILREELAPYGYLQANDVAFTVEDTDEIQMVKMKDDVPTGTIIISKTGELLYDRNEKRWMKTDFDWRESSLAGVTFAVYAAEDIVSPEDMGIQYYAKDELVAEIQTEEDGTASIEGLPLGRYYLKEIETAEGFVLNGTPIMAELTYVDQNTPVVYAQNLVFNERQKVSVTVIKKDAVSRKRLEGAVFGLFAKEDILDSNGQTAIEADEMVEYAATNFDGKITFVSDLPLGEYYLMEMEAPEGYATSRKIYEINARYQGDDVDVIEVTAVYEEQPIRVSVSKTDITGDHELAGATLTVLDSKGNVVESWVSSGEPHLMEYLAVGSYILREESAPYGYKLAADITFEVLDTEEIQTVQMKDDYLFGKIRITKHDSLSDKKLDGVEFEIRDREGNVLETLVTDEQGYAESKELPIGTYSDNGSFAEHITYTLVETKAKEGYELDSRPYEIVLSYEGTAPETVEYMFDIGNQKKPDTPKTGDGFQPVLMAAGGIVSLLLFVWFWGKRKKHMVEV